MSAGADVKNGFTRLANELIEALSRVNLGQHESRVIWAVIRKTYGWNKAWDVISASQIADISGLERRNASKARRKLLERRILVLDDQGQIAINKHVEQWDAVYRGTHPGRDGCVPGYTPGVYPRTQGCVPTYTPGVYPGTQEDLPISGQETAPEGPETKTNGSKKSTKGGVYPGTPQNTPNTGKDTKSKERKDTSSGGRKTPRRGNGKTPPPTAATWEAYSRAYTERYGVEPIRNKTVNSQLAKLINRVGNELAPLVAAYYVTLNTRWYVQKGHTVGPMLVDAEKLATECRTNTRITETSARRSDQSADRLSVFEQLLLEERAKSGHK